MRRVQNHFGIPSSSIAQSDIDERKHERIVDWVVETKTVVEEEEEEEEPLDTAGGSIQQTEPSRSRRQQGENSIELSGSSQSVKLPLKPLRISNSSTPDGSEVSDPYELLGFPRKREAIALYGFDGELPGDLRFKKDDLITATNETSSTMRNEEARAREQATAEAPRIKEIPLHEKWDEHPDRAAKYMQAARKKVGAETAEAPRIKEISLLQKWDEHKDRAAKYMQAARRKVGDEDDFPHPGMRP
jgi:hypothetical protein